MNKTHHTPVNKQITPSLLNRLLFEGESTFKTLALAATIVATVTSAEAASQTWKNTGADWNTGANWVGGAVPGQTGSVQSGPDSASFISAVTAVNPSLSAAQWTISTLNIDNTQADYNIDTTATTNILSLSSGGIAITGGGTTSINPVIRLVNGQAWNTGTAALTLANGLQVNTASVLTLTNTTALQINGVVQGFTTGISGNGNQPNSSASNLFLTGAGSMLVNGVVQDNGLGTSTTGISLNSGFTGTLTLTNANTYTGTTTIAAGVLNIQNNNALGSTVGATSVANSAALQIQGGITVTGETLSLVGGGVSNTGAMRNISGNNEWAGTINVNLSGVAARITSDSGTLTLSGNIVTTGGNNLILTGLGTGVVSGNISGSATVVTGAAATTWILSGANTYTGLTSVSNLSTLQIGNGGTTGSLSTGSTITNNGNLIFNRSNVVTQGSDFTSAGISGTGTVTQAGSGTLTLSSANTYTGNTTVSLGTLLVNTPVSGSDSGTGTGSVSISATGTLGGTGQITPGTGKQITVANGGTIAPGASSIGTLTINGANTGATVLSLTSGAKFAFELNTSFASDTISLVNGAAADIAFSGNAINFTDLSAGSLASGAYTLFTSNVAGAYTGLTTDGGGIISAGLTIGTGLSGYIGSTLQVVGNDIVLNVVPEPSVLALFGLGLSAGGVLLRRYRKPSRRSETVI